MGNLVVFGDSFTYGHGLPDCHIDPFFPGPLPSKMGWPNLLANKLNLSNTVNLSTPGASNRYILHKVGSYDQYEKNDIVLVQFSFCNRDSYFNKSNILKNLGNYNLEESETNTREVHWEYYLDRTELEMVSRTFEFMLLCYYILLEKNIKFYFLSAENLNILNTLNNPSDQVSTFKSNYLEKIKSKFITDPITQAIRYMNKNKDYALDGNHPGLKSQEICASIIYSYLAKKTLI